MSALGMLRTNNPTSAEEIATHLEDANVEDIRHRHYLGGTAYGDMLDASDAVLFGEEGFTLMGLYKITRALGDLKKGSVVMLHKQDEMPAAQCTNTFIMSVDSVEGAVIFEYPSSSEYIADRLVAAEGLRRRMLLEAQTDTQPTLATIAKYPDNHVSYY